MRWMYVLAFAAFAGCHHYRSGYPVDQMTTRPDRVQLELVDGRVVELEEAARIGDSVIGYGRAMPRVRSAIPVDRVRAVRPWRLNTDALIVSVLTAMALGVGVLAYLAAGS